MSIQLLVVLVPVMFGLMGFAFDLGRLYLIRAELNQAASAMALAAAGRLIGTSQSLDAATAASREALDNTSGHGPKYNFGAIPIGETTGLLSSSVSDPAYFSLLAAANGDTSNGGDQADGTTARHVQVTVNADAPLLFWALLSVGQQRKTPIAATAVAGISSPLCRACGIEPLAVAALSTEDTTNFGFTTGTRYTFAYTCTAVQGTPPPAALSGTSQLVSYLILNHQDANSTLDESQQLYRIGAQGLPPSTTRALACVTITTDSATETMWVSAPPAPCNSTVAGSVTQLNCGIYSRFDFSPPTACQTVTDIDTLATYYQPDTDLTDLDDYTQYLGNTRRILTVPIVDTLSTSDPMNILGFRQFLLEPTPNADPPANNPADQNARFAVLYIGSVVPVRQGSFAGCQITAGPGKVVLHQ